jgi:dTMP kinase
MKKSAAAVTRLPRPVQPGRYYGQGLPYLPLANYPGTIIAVEGTDGVGRSTQISLLREWLEVQGYGVVETGWTRSPLMRPTIDLAKSSNTLNKLTFVLLYATDFADRMEKEIIPALKSGFVVLADRYIFTALARAGVRGVDRAWLRALYGFAIMPHLVVYLRIDVPTLTRRVLKSRGMDFWESGMDLKLADDI